MNSMLALLLFAGAAFALPTSNPDVVDTGFVWKGYPQFKYPYPYSGGHYPGLEYPGYPLLNLFKQLPTPLLPITPTPKVPVYPTYPIITLPSIHNYLPHPSLPVPPTVGVPGSVETTLADPNLSSVLPGWKGRFALNYFNKDGLPVAQSGEIIN